MTLTQSHTDETIRIQLAAELRNRLFTACSISTGT